MFESLRTFLSEIFNISPQSAPVDWAMVGCVAVCAVAVYYLTKGVLRMVEHFVAYTDTTWDDDLLTPRLLQAISQLSPAILVHCCLPRTFDLSHHFKWVATLTDIYIVATVVAIIAIFIGNLYEALAARPRFKAYAIKGIFQMLRLIIICMGIIYAIALLAGRSPWAIYTALGASAAVLMLVFKDTILGLVASVQLSANKMVHRGDWIVCERHGANGEVEDISLTTVKVRNWDNSITTIPPYVLISESFRNYQPMRRSGGRRVDRSIIIDANSVRFLAPQEVDNLIIKHFVTDQEEGDHHINLTLLRRYLEKYLAGHPAVNHGMLMMVRQMEPTPAGLPLQLYFFTNETGWKEFERVQSDIFDHVYATIDLFGLCIYQAPAGADVRSIAR